MSVSQAQIESLAKMISEHDGLDGLRERVQKNLFDRFRTATPDEREVINSIMDNEGLFFTEVRSVVASLDSDKPINQDEEDK